jgi:hypothetical protein
MPPCHARHARQQGPLRSVELARSLLDDSRGWLSDLPSAQDIKAELDEFCLAQDLPRGGN